MSKEAKAAYMRRYRAEHPEYRKYMKAYSKTHKSVIYANHNARAKVRPGREKALAEKRAWSRKQWELNREKELERRREYCRLNPDKRSESIRKSDKKCAYARHLRKMESDENYAIRFRTASRIRSAIKRNGGKKGGRTLELIGCTIPELRAHLEKQFRPGMSWETYGKWEIDHIIPCAEFDLRVVAQQFQCFHYTNLQPLWKAENQSKGCQLTFGQYRNSVITQTS